MAALRVTRIAQSLNPTEYAATQLQLPKNKSVKNQKLCIKMQSMFVFLDITKFADFRGKNADVSRTQGVCHVIHMFFGSYLSKV